MTWLKIGEEFPLDAANADLSDAAFRTHIEGLSYAMDRENNGRFGKREVKRFAETSNYDAAVQELLDSGFWRMDGPEQLRIVHHIDEQPTAEYLTDQRKNNAVRKQRERESKALVAQGYGKEDVDRILAERGLTPKPQSQGESYRESHRDRTRDPERSGTERSGAEQNSSLDKEASTQEKSVRSDYCAAPGCGKPLTRNQMQGGCSHCDEHWKLDAA